MRTYTLYPKLYIGGWYHLKNPFHYVAQIKGKIVAIAAHNIYLN